SKYQTSLGWPNCAPAYMRDCTCRQHFDRARPFTHSLMYAKFYRSFKYDLGTYADAQDQPATGYTLANLAQYSELIHCLFTCSNAPLPGNPMPSALTRAWP